MTKGRFSSALAVMAIVAAALVAAVSLSTVDQASARETNSPSASEREMRRDLDRLADAWSLGGGRFGYPFWEKAMQRWRAGEQSTAMFREYVTGYRDLLRAGCKLLRATDISSTSGRDVRTLLVDSCDRRLDALGAQQQWLDALVDKAAQAGSRLDARTDDEAIAKRAQDLRDLQEEATRQEAKYTEAIESSYRDARLAMDLAQHELDQASMQRIPEDAFV